MPFVKLDTGILDSTLWIEKDQRDVFITALLMAEPKEFMEPLPQIEVDSLTFTGFSAPPGWYGFVGAAGIGILNRGGIDRSPGMKALRALGAPEEESRSKDFEGRRMIRVDGGYLILNFMKYRDRDYGAKDRMRRLRERRRENTEDVTRNVTSVPPNVTQAEDRGQSAEDRVQRTEEENTPPPESGSELALAAWLFEEANVPCDNAMVRVGGDCIRKLAREAGICNKDAARVILDAARAAIVDGEQITRFWLTDQRYKPQKPKKSKRESISQPIAEAPGVHTREQYEQWAAMPAEYRAAHKWIWEVPA